MHCAVQLLHSLFSLMKGLFMQLARKGQTSPLASPLFQRICLLSILFHVCELFAWKTDRFILRLLNQYSGPVLFANYMSLNCSHQNYYSKRTFFLRTSFDTSYCFKVDCTSKIFSHFYNIYNLWFITFFIHSFYRCLWKVQFLLYLKHYFFSVLSYSYILFAAFWDILSYVKYMRIWKRNKKERRYEKVDLR